LTRVSGLWGLHIEHSVSLDIIINIRSGGVSEGFEVIEVD
jgi:hypothetical protein